MGVKTFVSTPSNLTITLAIRTKTPRQQTQRFASTPGTTATMYSSGNDSDDGDQPWDSGS